MPSVWMLEPLKFVFFITSLFILVYWVLEIFLSVIVQLTNLSFKYILQSAKLFSKNYFL